MLRLRQFVLDNVENEELNNIKKVVEKSIALFLDTANEAVSRENAKEEKRENETPERQEKISGDTECREKIFTDTESRKKTPNLLNFIIKED